MDSSWIDDTHEANRVSPVDEPPGADPHAGWCGEGRLEAGPYPIGHHGYKAAMNSSGDASA
jgi:hypothetical protein